MPNLSTIKPLDEASILELAKECGQVVTVEERKSRAVWAPRSRNFAQKCPVPMEFVG